MRRHKRQLVMLALAASVLVLGTRASAADGDPYLKSCHSVATPPCTLLSPSFKATDAELSPDGKQLYVVVWDNGGGYNGIRLFDVASAGTITPRPDGFVLPGQANDVDISPDGRSVYASAGSQLVVFSRDPATGELAQAQCFGAAPCAPVTANNSFDSAAVSPEGTSVYVRGSGQLVVFDRIASGTLGQKSGPAGCFTEELTVAGCTPAAGIAQTGLETAVSPDGRHVYVSNQSPGGVAVFQRGADGSLSQAAGTTGGCVTAGGTSGATGGIECVNGPSTLTRALAANVDAQGDFVFVSGEDGNTVFRRGAGAGTLTQTDCLDELGPPGPPAGCHEVKGAAGADAAATPDGTNVVLNAGGFGLSFFTLDRGSGKLTQRPSRSCVSGNQPSTPCEYVGGLMGGLGNVTISGNGLYVFAAFRGGANGAVASFERDLAPRCRNRSVSVRRTKSAIVPLTCTDANGDAIRLDIATPPLEGTLGTIDQKNGRVTYRPSPDAAKTDSFQYRGTARGAAGPVAKVKITILGRRQAADRTPPNTRITSGPKGTIGARSARFLFRSNERGSTFQCKVDRKRWATCRPPKRYGAFRRGLHTFRVRAIDRAGNVDRSPAKRSWRIR